MKPRLTKRPIAALTLIDVLVLIGIIVILAGLLLPTMTGSHHAPRIMCVSNLKQIGLAFRLWANDNNDKFPMKLTDSPNPFSVFQVLSNELNDPRILVCPADNDHSFATNFTTNFHLKNISYFVGLDVSTSSPAMFLAGDRNITNGITPRRGILELTTNQIAGWTDEIHHGCGNIGLADGSVQQATFSFLGRLLQESGVATNRLALP